jgi:hypothetical protein
MPQWDVEYYEVVEQNLEGLTANIPDMPLGEVPRHFSTSYGGGVKVCWPTAS